MIGSDADAKLGAQASSPPFWTGLRVGAPQKAGWKSVHLPVALGDDR